MGYLFRNVELWINYVLMLIMGVLLVWALIDCATRKSQAFPAVNKLTKPAWLAITAACMIIGGLVAWVYGPLNVIALIALLPALVYLADVRPAVREVSGGSGSRW